MIYELVKPGYVFESIPEISQEDFRDLTVLMEHLITSFFEANHVLILYKNHTPTYDFEISELSEEIKADLRVEIAKLILTEEPEHDLGKLEELIELNLPLFERRYRWKQGQLPEKFKRDLPRFYAKNFVFALDNFQTSLKVISKIPNLPNREVVKNILKQFDDHFIHLRHVRNSAHHMEDRLRGLGSYNRDTKRKEKIQPQPFNGLGISTNGGNLFVDCLLENHYSFTNEDGSLGSVEISDKSMHVFQYCLQELIYSFEWKKIHTKWVYMPE